MHARMETSFFGRLEKRGIVRALWFVWLLHCLFFVFDRGVDLDFFAFDGSAEEDGASIFHSAHGGALLIGRGQGGTTLHLHLLIPIPTRRSAGAMAGCAAGRNCSAL